MRKHVSTWEELPKGVWLDNDEYGVHWYQANDGTHWYSTDDGYSVWEEKVEERQAPIVQPHTTKSQHNFDDDYFPRYDFDDDDDDDDDYESGSFGRRKFPFLTVAIVLILMGGGGAAGYLVYDFFNKTPEVDFYGTTYWGYSDGEVYGYRWTENSFDIMFFEEEGECDDTGFIGAERYKNSDYLCSVGLGEMGMEYTLVEEDDHYELCSTGTCSKFYPVNRGLVGNEGGNCTAMVSDIGTPTFTLYDDGDITSYVVSESWKDTYQDIVEDIEKNLPSSC